MLSQTKAREIFRGVQGQWETTQEHTRAVIGRFHNGFYLWGEGGIGKSYQVLELCKKLAGDRLKHLNTRLTAAGFFDLMSLFPDHLYVIEDVETVFDDRKAWGLLRAALWGQKDRQGVEQRLVTWTTANDKKKYGIRAGSRQFNFTGQIIIIANTRLVDQPEVRALADRIPQQELCLTTIQIQAAMIEFSRREWRHNCHVVTARECGKVTRFLIEEIERQEMRISLRVRELALAEYLAWREGITRQPWETAVKILVEEKAAMQEVDGIDGKKRGIKERMLAEEQTLREILIETPVWKERVELWTKRTGLSQRTFYRRMSTMGL